MTIKASVRVKCSVISERDRQEGREMTKTRKRTRQNTDQD